MEQGNKSVGRWENRLGSSQWSEWLGEIGSERRLNRKQVTRAGGKAFNSAYLGYQSTRACSLANHVARSLPTAELSLEGIQGDQSQVSEMQPWHHQSPAGASLQHSGLGV